MDKDWYKKYPQMVTRLCPKQRWKKLDGVYGGVLCMETDEKICSTCGWNPVEIKRRSRERNTTGRVTIFKPEEVVNQ